MKYAIIRTEDTEIFDTIFDTEEEAIEAADYEWSCLHPYDKKKCISYVVAEVELDEDGYVDRDKVWRYCKEYK